MRPLRPANAGDRAKRRVVNPVLGVRPEQAAVLRLALACITHPGLGSAALADVAPADVLQLIGARLRGKTPVYWAMSYGHPSVRAGGRRTADRRYLIGDR